MSGNILYHMEWDFESKLLSKPIRIKGRYDLGTDLQHAKFMVKHMNEQCGPGSHILYDETGQVIPIEEKVDQ